MIVVVAPEPAPWVEPLCRALGEERISVIAPWATKLPGLARRRLALEPAHLESHVAWLALEAAERLWTRRLVDRVYRARFAKRALVDALTAHRLGSGVKQVVAPSLAAQRTFARARALGARTLLVEDLPHLRLLHQDLDRCAARHPDSRFARRFRADPRTVAQQEAERVMADRILVRSGLALEALGDRARPIPAVSMDLPPATAGAPRILLAGSAAARHGVHEALLARGNAELCVRTGEGAEPVDLLSRPGVRRATGRELLELEGIGLVLAPAWVECHLPEVERAAVRGIPVVATRRAVGALDLKRVGREVQPGDADAMRAAITELLGTVIAPAPSKATWAEALS